MADSEQHARRGRSAGRFVENIVADESGVTAIEYGLVAALIAVAIIGAASLLGSTLGDLWLFPAIKNVLDNAF